MRYLDKLTSEQRKQHPMAEGLMDYFPDSLAVISHVSWVGNEKHNPGEPLHWARGKSTDQANCIVRHMATRDDFEVYEINGEVYKIPHWAQAGWRILAYGQEWMEREHGLMLPRGAKE